MASSPLKPHWEQPSHPAVLEVVIGAVDGAGEFSSKSVSKVTLPPFGLFANLSFPPCTMAEEPTYATVQCGKNKHLDLNSDLLYINHSCEPSLIFDTASQTVIAGPKGLVPGDELTFFYPSTEWSMAQPFDCLCGKPTCRGRISGARDMTKEQLEGMWLNGHIRELLAEQEQQSSETRDTVSEDLYDTDQTAQALRDALQHAEKVVEAARTALMCYARTTRTQQHKGVNGTNGIKAAANGHINGNSANGHHSNGHAANGCYNGASTAIGAVTGSLRRGPTSRELSGEMGGDTIDVV